jgi:uncharacterized membrane protein
MIAPTAVLLWKVNVSFPTGPAIEQIVLRWIHIVAGITWIGLLYFFNLIATPVMAQCDPQMRSRVYAELMPRAMGWFRFSAALTWLAGFRYFMILAQTDAANANNPGLAWRWIGIWFASWVVTFAVLNGLLRAWSNPVKGGVMTNGLVMGIVAFVVMGIASWLVLDWISSPATGNRTLTISIGGGLGTIMLMSVWGIVWRCQKRLIAWHKASVAQGTPMPPEAAKLARLSFLTARLNFWISFPMIFFMAAASHYPFLSGR